ncbi:MAG: ester cyclase [Acidobacteria bacterium]|nr:MAG: ester cyclase [Acidobacteriota bacterium]PYV80094.1 MAG: ester cyclase [Acidobacteriota bacterium]
MAAQNAELSRRIFEDVWNRKNLSAIDDLISADYVHHDANSPAASGIDGYKQFVNYYMNAFPDAHFTIDDAFTDGQNEVTRWTVVGTHEGELAGIPRTGRRFSVTGITIARIANGKITESWNNWDALGLMQQLGVVSEAKGRAA